MSNLQQTVELVLQDLVSQNKLFTALDVSNTVKTLLPHSRHREVRDVVRNFFTTSLASQGWSRTPITVTLADGTTADALLYHPASDTWDLDNKYDQQKRHQTVVNPTAAANVVAAASAPAPATASVTVSATVVPMPTARQLWDQMFDSQPSLFPSK